MQAQNLDVGQAPVRHKIRRKRAVSVPWILLFGLMAGTVLRILVMHSTWQQPDTDQATGMMMAYRASQGHFVLLFWGGDYGGAAISWIEAPLVATFGLNIGVFQVVDTLQTLIAVVLLWRIGERLFTSAAAQSAAATWWVFPATWVYWSSREYVFWLPSLILALAADLLILRWYEERSGWRLFAGGLCAGLSIWSYPLVITLVAPASILLFWTLRRKPLELVTLAGGAVAGVAPWLAYFVIHGQTALHLLPLMQSKHARFVQAITEVFPSTLVGGQRRSGVVWANPDASLGHLRTIGVAVIFAVMVLTVLALINRRWGLVACGASILLWPVVLVAAHVPAETATFRYGFVILPPFLLLTAYLAGFVRMAPIVGFGAGLLSLHTVWSDTNGLANAPFCDSAVTKTLVVLKTDHRHAAWSSYWLSGPLEACSKGQIAVSPTTTIRDVYAMRSAAGASNSTYVVFPASPIDQQIGAWVSRHKGAAVRDFVSKGYAVWLFKSRVEPATMNLSGYF